MMPILVTHSFSPSSLIHYTPFNLVTFQLRLLQHFEECTGATRRLASTTGGGADATKQRFEAAADAEDEGQWDVQERGQR